jgi:hypothetical protein
VQIDFRLSFIFTKEGGVSVKYAPLVPDQFKRDQKELMVWQDAYIHATLDAIDKFLADNGKIGKRQIKKFMKIRERDIKEQRKRA